MKKWLISLLVIIALFLMGSYFFIPATIVIRKSITTNSNQQAVFRFLSNEANWSKWWPGKLSNDKAKTTLASGNYQFKPGTIFYNSFQVLIEKGNQSDTSFLHLLPLSIDSTILDWSVSINTGNDPITKFRQYLHAKELSADLNTILIALQSYIGDTENVYGLAIRREKVMVENLITTKKSFSYYPKPEDIYAMINETKNYILLKQAKEEDYPMLNISASDSTYFEVRVAIPIDKVLPNTEQFSSKKMLKQGNILVAEIKGGKNAFDSAMKKIDLYVGDYRLNNIALPFQSLITDRSKEADSSKWVTRIYYPII